MSTQAWQPQSAQPSAPSQPTISGSPGHCTPGVASPVQAQGMSQSPFPAPSSTLPPPSPSNAAPAFRGPSPSSSNSTSAQPPQPATPPPANLGQANSNSTRPVSGYPPPPTSYPVPRWQPPPLVLTPAGPGAIQSSRGPPGAVAPPGPPWISVRPISPGLTAGLSTVSRPPGISSSQESSTSIVPPPIPPGGLHPPVANPPPSTSAPSVSVSPVVSVPSSFTSSMPLGSLGLSGPSVPPGTPGPPGLSRPPSLLHSTPAATFGFTQPSISPGRGTASGPLSSPGPSRITSLSVAPPGISTSAGQASSSGPPPPPSTSRLEAAAETALAVSSDGPPAAAVSSTQLSDPLGGLKSSCDSTGLHVNSESGPRPAISSANSVSMAPTSGPAVPPVMHSISSIVPVSTPPTAGLAVPPVMQPISSAIPVSTPPAGPAVPPVIQPLQYGPYLSVPPVPQMLPWQVHPRPFFPLPMSIRPVIPPQAGIPLPNRPLIPNTAALAPPGEQASSHVTILKSSINNVGSIVAPVSSLSANGLATSTGSVLKSNLTLQLSVPGLPTVSTDTKNAAEAGRKSEVPLKDEVADAWTAHKTADGTLYYYNSITGQSTYEKPSGFQGEVDKVTAQPTPVSWEMVSGTGWALVTTNDGKKYYYHTVTQATSWQVPTEVTEFRKRLKEDVPVKLSLGLMPTLKPGSEKGPVSFSLNIPGIGGREVPKAFVPAASSSALDLVKKKLQDSVSPGSGALASNLVGPAIVDSLGLTDTTNRGSTTEGSKEKPKESATETFSSDSSTDSEDEDRGPTKDECVTQFKEMLKEKGIVPFSKWEKELPKIIFDPRFKAIPSHTERRSIFDHYVRTRAEEERKEKRAAQKAAVEGFKELLEEASKEITYKTDYTSFAKEWAGDARFDTLERKEREMLLHERVLPLRRAEEERVRAIHAAAVAGFNAMLLERGEITTSSRWSRIKDSLRNDPRYRAVKREDREALFNAFVDELQAVEQEAERSAKAKREEEERLREREREMRKRKEREEQEVERVRVKARRKDAVNAYQALLTEKIKDPEASWTEARPKLEKDGLGRATNPELDSADRERLFRDHVNALYERAAREYRALLADVITVDAASKQSEDGKNIFTSWSEAKKLMKSDARYSKMPRRERESLWRRYAEDVQRRLKGSGSTNDERHPGTDSGKGGALDSSTKHSPGHRRNSSRR